MGQEKTEIRRRVLSAIEALPPAERTARSAAAQKALVELPEFQAARAVFVYHADPTEVDTRAVMAEALRMHKRLGLPRVDKPSREMRVLEVADLARDLVADAFGIPAPRPECPEIPAGEIDLAIVPGRVFDAAGRRMGRGAGFYDRFLAKPDFRAIAVSLAFECQLVETVPSEPHDRNVAVLVTEARVLRPGGART
ncbi:MAG: 5-formyltetrahydrofolate cyclo-ligase [Planctomycetota bacterium]|nr:5-formyltetrahydrofolate cyclo-ligase [Planctomycetota bacterium]